MSEDDILKLQEAMSGLSTTLICGNAYYNKLINYFKTEDRPLVDLGSVAGIRVIVDNNLEPYAWKFI